ncbi:hypothetical protein FRC09_010685 [Ceratobasidium sp. 395]|nr:hypothetical protein FRC09_010685 [Ceratobasidium sp. 395]
MSTVSALAGLPTSLTDEHKLFWNDYTGERFRSHIGPRGKKNENGKTYARRIFIEDFCDKFYPSLSTADREKFEADKLGKQVYIFLTNNTARNREFKPKTEIVKQRIYGYDVWRQENREAFDEALHNYQAEYPNWVSNVGTRRSLTIEFFRRLSEDDQQKYQKMAKERLATIHSLHNLSGENRMLYVENFMKQLHAMFKQGDACAGIKANAQVLYVDDTGNYHITTIVTESMGDLEDAPEVDRLVQRMKDWVKDTAGKNIDTESGPTVYPDYDHDMYPLVPVVTGLKVVDLQKILRLQFSMLWAWQGGYGRFPWDLVGGDLDSWIPSNRRPTGAILGDPTSLRLASLAAWLEYFQDSQSGKIPLDHRLQFSKVFAGLSPIDPNISQESSRRLEHVPQHNKESWVLEFSDTVTRCHAPGGVEYPEPSIAYARLLKRNELTALAAAQRAAALTKPDYFLDLPTGDQSPSALIDGQEKALIFKWAESLKEDDRALVIELVDSINEHQAHSPASTPCGIWFEGYATNMPALFPSSPDSLVEGLQFTIPFWLKIGSSSDSGLTSRFLFLRLCLEDTLSSHHIRHGPSGTLIGGHNGPVWHVRAHILTIFTFAAINGDMAPPCDPPADFDVTPFTPEDQTRMFGLARSLVEALKASTATLALTSAERRSYVTPDFSQEPVAVPSQSFADQPPSSPALPSTLSTDAGDAAPRPSSAPPAQTTTQKGSRSKGKKKQTGASDGAHLDESSMSSGVSDKTAPEVDYDALDPPGSDAGSSEFDPDGYSRDLQPNPPPFRPSSRSARTNAEGDNQKKVLPGGYLYWLRDKCGHLFDTDYNSSDSGNAFGPFPPLPPASQSPLPKTYATLCAGIEASTAKLDSALRGWMALSESNKAVLDRDARAAQHAAHDVLLPLQLLVEFATARRLAWERAKLVSPSVLGFAAHIVPIGRTAIQMDTAVGDFLNAEDRAATMSDAERDTLCKSHRHLLKLTIQLCWVYKELLAWNELAADWSNRFPDTWAHDPLSTNGHALYAQVAPLYDWVCAARDLANNLRAERKATWPPIGRPFEPRHRRSLWYWFGNPQPEEVPEGLRAALQEIECIIGDALDDMSSSSDMAGSKKSSPPTSPPPPTAPQVSPSTGGVSATAAANAASATAPSSPTTGSQAASAIPVGADLNANPADTALAAQVTLPSVKSAGTAPTPANPANNVPGPAVPVPAVANDVPAPTEAAPVGTTPAETTPTEVAAPKKTRARASTIIPNPKVGPAANPAAPAPRETRAAAAAAAATAATTTKATNHASSTTRKKGADGNAGRGGKRGRGRKSKAGP